MDGAAPGVGCDHDGGAVGGVGGGGDEVGGVRAKFATWSCKFSSSVVIEENFLKALCAILLVRSFKTWILDWASANLESTRVKTWSNRCPAASRSVGKFCTASLSG